MASFLRRFFSRRKKLPENTDPKNNVGKEKSKPKDSIQCNIILLDNETLTLDLPVCNLLDYFIYC